MFLPYRCNLIYFHIIIITVLLRLSFDILLNISIYCIFSHFFLLEVSVFFCWFILILIFILVTIALNLRSFFFVIYPVYPL